MFIDMLVVFSFIFHQFFLYFLKIHFSEFSPKIPLSLLISTVYRVTQEKVLVSLQRSKKELKTHSFSDSYILQRKSGVEF